MTQDQRYDMITEMYEATRYAKEIQKKHEQSKKTMDAINELKRTTTNKKITDKLDKKYNDALDQFGDTFYSDTKRKGRVVAKYKKMNMPEDAKASVRDARNVAKTHPGRYEKHVERKPGAYLRMQKEK